MSPRPRWPEALPASPQPATARPCGARHACTWSYQVDPVPRSSVRSAGRLLLLQTRRPPEQLRGAQERREASETLWAQAPGPRAEGLLGRPRPLPPHRGLQLGGGSMRVQTAQLERTSALSTHEHKAQTDPPAEGPGHGPRLQLTPDPFQAGTRAQPPAAAPRQASLSPFF